MTARSLSVALSLLAAVVLSGCSGDEDAIEVAADRSSAASSTAARTTAERTTAEPGSTTAAPVVPAAPVVSAAPEATASPSATWPAEAPAVHGARTWGVYLAVGDLNDPTIHETYEYAVSLGYEGAGTGSLGCDDGAAQALGVDPNDMMVAVYFADHQQADQFLALYDRPYVGVAEVTTYCLD